MFVFKKLFGHERLIISFFIIIFLLILIFLLFYVLRAYFVKDNKKVNFGATFSIKYAHSLGLDIEDTLTIINKELKLKYLRIPIYWDLIEKEKNKFDFSEFDRLIGLTEQKNYKLILAIGRKLPRWPECHQPQWVEGLDEKEVKKRVFLMLRKVVEHYKNNPNLYAWQIENEALFPFGECDEYSWSFLKKEVSLVKQIDSTRSILITDSGEFSSWIRTALAGDILGISVYRQSYFSNWLNIRYVFIRPFFYKFHALLIKPLVNKIMIMELQAEPWLRKSMTQASLKVQFKNMNADILKNNIEFAVKTGFEDIVLWGVEWWCWLKKQGHGQVFNQAKKMIEKYSK